MTTDALVSDDLAALATDNRRGIPAIDALLRPREEFQVEALPLLALSRIYMRRVATLSSGAVVLAFCIVLLLVGGHDFEGEGASLVRVLTRATSLKLLIVVLAARGIATHLASRSFERRLRAGASATRLVQAVDGWSVAFGIAGTTALGVIVGASQFGIGDESWTGGGMGLNFIDALHALIWQSSLAVAVAIGAGFALGRAVARGRRWTSALETRVVAIAGVVVLFATLYVATRFDVGDLQDIFMSGLHADLSLRLGLTFAGMLGVLAMSASLSLHRRRREISELDRSIT